MSNETEQAVRSAFVAGTNTVSDATAQTFRDQLAARGVPADQIDATLRAHGYGQQAGQSNAPAPKAAPMRPDIDPATGVRGLTSEETLKAADTLRKFWTGSPEALEAALERAGVPRVDAPADTRTEAQKEFDASSLAPPVDPSSYNLNGIWLQRSPETVTDMAKFDGMLRQSLSALRVPQALGQSFAEDFLDAAAATDDLAERDEAAQQQFHLEQRSLFAKVTKVGWAEAAAQMKPWLATMPTNIRDFLRDSGGLNAAPAMIRLWQSYQLATARSRMGGTKPR